MRMTDLSNRTNAMLCRRQATSHRFEIARFLAAGQPAPLNLCLELIELYRLVERYHGGVTPEA